VQGCAVTHNLNATKVTCKHWQDWWWEA